MEKQAALAVPEEKKGMTIWNSTQGHDFCRAKPLGRWLGAVGLRLAGVLGVPGAFVVCKQTRAGGAFGPKNSRQVPVAAMAAVAAHKRLGETRIGPEFR